VPIVAFAINRFETPVSEIRDIISKVLVPVILIKNLGIYKSPKCLNSVLILSLLSKSLFWLKMYGPDGS